MTNDLATRCEQARGADRALDAEISAKVRTGLPDGCEWAFKFPNWEAEHDGKVRIIGNVNGNGEYIAGRFTSPRHTASIDAALTLVPDAIDGTLMNASVGRTNEGNGRVRGLASVSDSLCGPCFTSTSATPALALCAAALKARAAKETP